MEILLENRTYTVLDVYDLSITVPDSFVINDNKTCGGHGEAKLYMGPKSHMRKFYTDDANQEGFESKCFILKSDLLQYMTTICHEYQYPSISYHGQNGANNMMHLWEQRKRQIEELPPILTFTIKDQNQIEGSRGYVKPRSNPRTGGFGLIRTISLPFVSYISIMKLNDMETNEIVFYWKLFTDFTQIAEQQYWAKNYGKRKNSKVSKIRDGQNKYRQNLFGLFAHCPFTKIDEISLLTASHIKPWAVCEPSEKTDIENGLMLSPLYDRLFDRGYISFDANGEILVSTWLSPANREKIDLSYSIEDLHLTPQRKAYMEYHRNNVFK